MNILLTICDQEIGSIQDRGWEVGLHGGHQGYRDLTKLKDEKKKLERITNNSVTGCRNHFLNFIVPDTWEIMKKAGFAYDCSWDTLIVQDSGTGCATRSSPIT